MAAEDDEMLVEEHVLDRGVLVLDARCFPVIVTYPTGEMGFEAAELRCRWLDRMVDRAIERDVRLVTISSTLAVKRPPKPVLRYIMEQTDARQKRAPGRELAGLVVVESAMMRGIVSLALWMGKQPLRMSTVATMPQAGRLARQLLEEAGEDVPPDLEAMLEQMTTAFTQVS